MPDPLQDRGRLAEALHLIELEAVEYLDSVDEALVRPPGSPTIDATLPSEGVGSLQALSELVASSTEGATRSTGPRFFHFVMGGVTPAALGADWLTSTLNQSAYNWVSSPLASRIEQVALDWMKELFGIPAGWSAVMTSAATTANLVGLAAARRWWGLQHGVDVDEQGMSGLPPVPILSGGYLHASAVKALGMLGLGRRRPHLLSADAAGHLDVIALEAALRALDGKPAIVIATAGDVNTGDFDPLREMSVITRRYGAWLHVDGAFGLYAALTPLTRHLVDGIEAADSIAVDGHKWLNAPYDTGFAFVRDPNLHAGGFSASAAYLGTEALARPVFGNLASEMSRRARALPVWATLRAYGRDGYRAMVERHLALAQRVARQVDEAPDLERLAPVPLNIVCFRFHPAGVAESELNELNRKLGSMVLEDGRVYFGTTDYAGKVAFRPAIVNWRTTEKDVDMIVPVARELGAKLVGSGSRAPGR
ncbi:MAG TPA: aminotransferase class V-fold PLP-dependent enzyme [Candidatus Sulfotelmatobacter sp.]|nr:aminotransferase class V-fold PLP-dependent enzyme [Candidatus Sulfotelmatobacter sp.]